jgi:hypothetical protein
MGTITAIGGIIAAALVWWSCTHTGHAYGRTTRR